MRPRAVMRRRRKRAAKTVAKGLQEGLKQFIGMPADKDTLDRMAALTASHLKGMLSRESFTRAIFPEIWQPLPPFRVFAHEGVMHLVGDTAPNANGDVFAARVCDRALVVGDWTPVPNGEATCLACLSREHDTRRAG